MIKVGDKFETKHNGCCIVTKYNGCENVEVMFIDTGNKRTCSSSKLRKGTVKDNLARSVFGVGFLGCGTFSYASHQRIYSIWHSMISRCYNKKNPSYRTYGGSGVTVSEEWHNFQNFAQWYFDNAPENAAPRAYDIDKDIKDPSCKQYSPDKCLIVKKGTNLEARFAKSYMFVSPDGETVKVYNLSKFCNKNKLSVGCMSMVHGGKSNHHKGWKKAD